MVDKKSVYNPWTLEDEKEHLSSALEWWCIEAFFKSIENNEKWTLKFDFTKWNIKPKSFGFIDKVTLLNQDSNEIFKIVNRNFKTAILRFAPCIANEIKICYLNISNLFYQLKHSFNLLLKCCEIFFLYQVFCNQFGTHTNTACACFKPGA